MAYGNFKDLPRRTATDKLLRDQAFKIPNYDVYQRELTSMACNFFNKKFVLLKKSETLATQDKSGSSVNGNM